MPILTLKKFGWIFPPRRKRKSLRSDEMGFVDFLNKCLQIKADELSLEIYQSTEFEFLVVSLITEGEPTSQLERGEGSQGFPLGFYSVFTERITGGRKKAGSPYTLNDSGFYWKSHELEIKLGGFRIIADDFKDGKSFLKELKIPEEEAQNLSDENLEIVIEEHKTLFSEAFRDLVDSFKDI